MTIEYRPGRAHSNADALSRMYSVVDNTLDDEVNLTAQAPGDVNQVAEPNLEEEMTELEEEYRREVGKDDTLR